MVGEPGFEPELPGPEPRVLPLNYSPMGLNRHNDYHILSLMSRWNHFLNPPPKNLDVRLFKSDISYVTDITAKMLDKNHVY